MARPQTIPHYSLPSGRYGAAVRSICEDNDGHLWIGAANGLACFRNGQIEAITPESGMPDSSINIVKPAEAGGLHT